MVIFIFILFGLLILLLFLGVPIGFSLMLASFTYILTNESIVFELITQKFAGGISSFTLLAIPFFITTGKLMNAVGITNRLFNLSFLECLVLPLPILVV